MIRASVQQDLNKDKHLIDLAEFDITFSNQSLADEFQSRAQAFMLHDLLPVLEDVFEEFNKKDCVLSIDTLIIDIGNISARDYHSQLIVKVKDALSEQLKLLSNPSSPASSQLNLSISQPLDSEAFQTIKAHQDIRQCDYHKLPKTQANWLQLKYFLEYGVLSWNADANGFYTKAENWAVWFESTILAHLTSLADLLKTTGRKDALISRLLQNLSTDKAIICLLALTGESLPVALLLKIMFDHRDGQGFSQTETQFFTEGGWLSGRSRTEKQNFLRVLFLFVLKQPAGALLEFGLGGLAQWFSLCQPHAPQRMKAEFSAMFSSHGMVGSHADMIAITSAQWRQMPSNKYARQSIMALLTWTLLQGQRSGLLSIWPLAIHKYAKEFVLLLRLLGRQYGVRHILATELSEPMLIDLLILLEPNEHAFMLSFKSLALPSLFVASTSDLQEIAAQKRAPAAVAVPTSILPPIANSHRLFWEFTLSYLLVDRGGAFNRKTYLHSMLKQAASHQNVSQIQLHQFLCLSLSSLQADSLLARNMLQVLGELPFDVKPVPAISKADTAPAMAKTKGLTETEILMVNLAIALQQGRIELLTQHWSGYIGEHKQLLRQALYLFGRQSVIEMLVTRLSESRLQALLLVLAPAEKRFIVAMMAQLATRIVTAEIDSTLEATKVQQYLWQFSLCYLVTERGSVFNKLSYLGSVVEQMAAHHNVDHQQLIHGLISGFSSLGQQAGTSSIMQGELMELLVSLLLTPIDLEQRFLPLEHANLAAQVSDNVIAPEHTAKILPKQYDPELHEHEQHGLAQYELEQNEFQLLRSLVLALELSDGANLDTLIATANRAVLAKFALVVLHYGRSDTHIRRYLLALPKSTQQRLMVLFAPRLLVAWPVLMAQTSLLFVGATSNEHRSFVAQFLGQELGQADEVWLAAVAHKISGYTLSKALVANALLEKQLSLWLWRFLCREAPQSQEGALGKAGISITALTQYLIAQMAAYRHLSYETLLQAMFKEALQCSNHTSAASNVKGHKSAPTWLVDILRQCLADLSGTVSASLLDARSASQSPNPSQNQSSNQNPTVLLAASQTMDMFDLGHLMLLQKVAERLLQMAAHLGRTFQFGYPQKQLTDFVNVLIGLSKKDVVRCLALMQQALMQSLDWRFIYANSSWQQRQALKPLIVAVIDLSPMLTFSRHQTAALSSLTLVSSNSTALIPWLFDASSGFNLTLNRRLFYLVPQWQRMLKTWDLSPADKPALTGSAHANKAHLGNMAEKAREHAKLAGIAKEINAQTTGKIEQWDRLAQEDKGSSAEMLAALQAVFTGLVKADLGAEPYLADMRDVTSDKVKQNHKLNFYLTYLFKHDAAGLKACLLEHIGQGQVMQSLISIRSNNELTKLMTFLYGQVFIQQHTWLRSLLQSCPTLSHLLSDVNNRVWLFIAKTLVQGKKPEQAVMDFLQDIYLNQRHFKRVFSSWQHFLTQLSVEMKGNISLGGIQAELATSQLKLLNRSLQKLTTASMLNGINHPSATAKSAHNGRADNEPLHYEISRREISQPSIDQVAEVIDKIYVANAGLVLLTPYIARLFTMLSLTQQGAFIHDDAQEKALHVLQYLVNGQQDTPEFQLSLNKILCGMNTSKHLNYQFTLTQEDKDMAEGLLAGVIQHWRALGNTSADGLRQTFLQRDGIITLEKEAWKLRIQPKAFDVLLSSLPWSFGVIKLPWMERVLYVEWH